MTYLPFAKEKKAWKYIGDWDEIDGEITIYLKKPYVLKPLNAAQFSEFIDDFEGDEAKCLDAMYDRILSEVQEISIDAWEAGAV